MSKLQGISELISYFLALPVGKVQPTEGEGRGGVSAAGSTRAGWASLVPITSCCLPRVRVGGVPLKDRFVCREGAGGGVPSSSLRSFLSAAGSGP